MYTADDAMIETDNYGNIVKRPKSQYPYSYSTYVQWQHDDYDTMQATSGFYSDRLLQLDWNKYNVLAVKHFGDKAHHWWDRKPEDIEAFVRDWIDNETAILVQVQETCNVGNGFPLWYITYYLED